MEFKVGDRIVGDKDLDINKKYGITNENSLCEVIDIRNKTTIEVRLLATINPEQEEFIGSTHYVDANRFKFAEPETNQDAKYLLKKR